MILRPRTSSHPERSEGSRLDLGPADRFLCRFFQSNHDA
jgi:hypothetical protein